MKKLHKNCLIFMAIILLGLGIVAISYPIIITENLRLSRSYDYVNIIEGLIIASGCLLIIIAVLVILSLHKNSINLAKIASGFICFMCVVSTILCITTIIEVVGGSLSKQQDEERCGKEHFPQDCSQAADDDKMIDYFSNLRTLTIIVTICLLILCIGSCCGGCIYNRREINEGKENEVYQQI